MTLREKLCQLMIVRPEVLTGESPVTAAGETTRLALETYPVGGLIYSVDNLVTQEQTREMITNTQSYSSSRSSSARTRRAATWAGSCTSSAPPG